MYLLILFFPLLAFSQALLGGFFFGRLLSAIFSVFLLFVTMILSWFIFFEVCLSKVVTVIPLYH